MRTHTIAICGSGIGGLAAALALDARGHRVTLIEKVDTPRPLGAGLLLQPTGQAALARLGLLAPALELGRRIDGIEGRTDAGRTIFDIGYEQLGLGYFGVGIHRGTLFHILDDARRRRAIPTITATDVASSRLDGPKRQISDTTGRVIGVYDLVIDATGLHSPLRVAAAHVTLNRPYPYGAVWGVVREPPDWTAAHRLAQRYRAASAMVGILPIGRRPNSDQPLVAFFWSLKTAELERWRAADFGAWQQTVVDLWPESAPFVRQFTGHADLTPATYADVWLARPYADRLAFIGDAARAASPQLGQGANLALLDAVVLSDCLAEHPTIAEALAAYAAARRAHTRFYGRASRWLTPFFQSDSRLAATVRDFAFAPMAKVPYLNSQMVRTLGGLKTGLLVHQTPSGLAGSTPIEPAISPSLKTISPAAD